MIYRIVTMRCIVFTLTLALSHQGRGDLVGCVGLLLPRPCGYCLEASMTAARPVIPAQAGIQQGWMRGGLSLTSAVAVRRHGLVESLAIRLGLHLTADP